MTDGLHVAGLGTNPKPVCVVNGSFRLVAHFAAALYSQEATAPERRKPVAETMASEAASTWARVPTYFAVSATRQLAQSRFRVKHGTASMRSVRAAARNWSPAKWRDKPRE